MGLSVPDTDFEICDFDTHNLVPISTKGELCVRTFTLLKGYWNKPETIVRVLRDGWFYADDIGYANEQGYVHYPGRHKEMFKINGMNVFPAEIEAMLGKYPAILGSAVIDRADERRGQLPVAFVMLRPEAVDALDSATLTGQCHENMTDYKVPIVRTVDALSLTATGKTRKQGLVPFAEQL